MTMKKLPILWFCLLLSTLAIGQETLEIIEPEYIHLTTDKPFYFEEERIVFQAVAISNKSFNVVRRNDVLHAELLNEAGELLASERVLWLNGVANGEMRLPKLFEDYGTLYLHVYTPSLLDELAWVRTNAAIPVYRIPVSAIDENVLETASNRKEPELILYPSADQWVTNLPNQVFLRAANTEAGSTYKAGIIYGSGNVTDSIAIGKNLVGTFDITPKPNEAFTLALFEGKTIVWSKDFVPTNNLGLTLQAETDSTGDLELKILHTYPDERKVEIEITHGGQGVLKRMLALNQPMVTVLVPANKQSEDRVFSVRIKGSEGQVLLERLVFQEANDEQSLRWINQRAKLPSGSTPNLLFMVDSDSVDFSKSYLSVKLLDNRMTDAESSQLTTSGQAYQKHRLRRSGILTDKIPLNFSQMTATEKEAWLLTNRDDIILRKTRRVNDTVQLAPDPYQVGFRINGRITLKETGEPLAYCPLALANTSDFSLFRFTKTTKEGYFRFDNLRFIGENELFLVLQKFYEADVNIEIFHPKTPQFFVSEALGKPVEAPGSNQLLNEALERSIIDSVYAGTSEVVKVFEENNFISKIAGFFLEPTEVVDPLEYVPFNEMKDVFKEILPTAFLRFKKGKPLIRMVHSSMQMPPNAVVTGLMDVPSLVIVDGVPIFNQEEVLKINPATVTKYELYHGLFTLGYEVYLGLVHIVTNVDYLNKTDIKGLHKFKYKGVSPPSTIAMGPQGEPNSPYLSPVGFWITELKPDEKGVLQLPIRLTNVPGDYLLTLETINTDGKGMVMQWPLQIE